MRKFLFALFIILAFTINSDAVPPGGGAENFNELDDAPSTYAGQGGKTVTVKVDETGVEFTVPPGGGDMLQATYDTDADDDIDLAHGGTGAALADPNADRILFWDDSAGAITWLTPGNGFVFSATTLNLDLTPTAGSATLQYNDDALTVKYDATMFGEGANGLELDITPSSGNATLIVEEDALQVKYDAVVFAEGASGLTLDLTPSAGSATLVAEEDALQVKYDTTLTEGVNGLGVSNTLTNAHISGSAGIAFSKLATLADGNILVGSALGVATSVAMSGDVTILNTGATAIGANKVTGTMISIANEATGDLMNYNNVSGLWERLAAGTANYPLVSGGAGVVPSYAQLSTDGIANLAVTAGKIANNTITTGQLSASLIFADADYVDFSPITMSAGVDEGLTLPTWANVDPLTVAGKYFIAWDHSGSAIKVYDGGWVTVGSGGGGGAPTTASYLALALDGTLTAERRFIPGVGIGYSDGGVNSDYTISLDLSELTDNQTLWSGASATRTLTFNISGSVDPVLTAGDGYVNISTGQLQEGGRRVYSVGGTDVAVTDGGTGKSAWTQYAIPYADTTTSLSETAIGAGGYYLTVNGGATGYTWTAPLTMDSITDGPTNYQKVAAADVNASGHIDRFYDSDGTGYITVTGLSGASAKTFSDGAATVMEQGVSQGGLLFGDSTPDAAGEIGYATGVISFYNGSAAVNLVSESVATGGLILGDSSPDAAGEIGYASNVVSYYDGTAARTLMTLETAQNISGIKEIQDGVTLDFGTDADWHISYDETTNDQLLFSTAKTGAVSASAAMFKILVNSGAGTLTVDQNVFEVMNSTTSLMKVDEDGDLTINGMLTIGSTSGDSYIGMGGNTGGRAPTAASYEIYFDAGELSYNLNGTEKDFANLQDAQTFSGIKTFTGGLYLGNASTLGSMRIYDGSSNYVTIQAQSISADYTLTLPVDDGTSGQYLSTNGSGSLSWGTPTATAAGATTGMVQYNASGTGGALAGDAGFIFTAATDILTLGEDGQDGQLALFNDLAGGDQTVTIVPNSNQNATATITLPAATGTLARIDVAETISANYTFDDNSGDSPSVVFQDGTNTTMTLTKVDNSWFTMTPSSATYGLNILTGNLKVGNGVPTQTLNGEDFYVEGLSEFDSNIFADGGIILGTDGALGTAGEINYSSGAFGFYGANSEALLMTVGSASNTATFSSPVTLIDTINFTSINVGSSAFQPESLSNGSTVVRAGQTAANTAKIQAYDIDQGAFDDIITVSSHATLPTLTMASDGLATLQGITFPSGTYKMYRNTTTDGNTLCMQAYHGDSTAYVDALCVENSGASEKVHVTIGANADFVPASADGAALGSATNEFSDAYFYDGAIIYGQADQSATLTSSASMWTANNFGVTTQFKLPSSNADPTATAGYMRHDSTVSNHANGAVRWHDGTNIRQMVDMVAATVEACADTEVVAYSATNDNFYCKADATGGTTAINAIGDAAADGTIDQTGYKQTWTSTLNTTGAVWTFTNTTADLTADVSFMDFKYTDDGDANGYFMRGYDNAGNDLKWSIAADGAANFSTVTTTAMSDPYVYFNEADGTDWYIGVDDTGNTLEFRTNATVGNSVVMELNEDGTGLSIGDAGDDDITLTFNANSNDGTIQWMEDEEEFRIASSGGESLYIDLDTGTANEIGFSTGSSADKLNFNSFNMVTTGYIQGAIRYIAVDSTDADDTYTIAAADGYGTMITNAGDDDALTINLPDVVAGMSVCVAVVAAYQVTIEPNGSERIIVDTNTNGDYIRNSGTAGDYYCLMGISATEWLPLGKKGTWTEQ